MTRTDLASLLRRGVPLNLALQMRLLLASQVISSADATDLRSYFGSNGMGSIDRSPMASMLARAELFRGHQLPCLKCGGVRARDGRPEKQGCGSACTAKQLRNLALLGLAPDTDEKCRACKGTGWVVRRIHRQRRVAVTARPTGCSVKVSAAPSASMSDSDVHLVGAVGRRLAAAESITAGSVRVLELYYGTARFDGGRRLTTLWSLTQTGKCMLARNKVAGLDPDRFFQNERDAESHKPDQRKRDLFLEADREAAELRANAARVWNVAGELRTLR